MKFKYIINLTIISVISLSDIAYSIECSKLNSIVDYFNEYNKIGSPANKIKIINKNNKWDLAYDNYYSSILEKLTVDVKNGYILLGFHFGDGINYTEAALFSKNDKTNLLCIKIEGGLYGKDSLNFYKCNNSKLIMIKNPLPDADALTSLDESFLNKNKVEIEKLYKKEVILKPFYKLPQYGIIIKLKYGLSFQAYLGNNLTESEKKLVKNIEKNIKYSFEYEWNVSSGNFVIKKVKV